MALPPRDQRHQYLRYEGLQYTEADIADFESRLARIYRREGVSLFTSRAWRWLFDIRGPFVHELILEFFSTFRLGEAILDLDTPRALQFQLGGARKRLSWRQFILALGLHTDEEMQTTGFGAYWAESARHILDKEDLRDYWIGISSAGDFLGTAPSYTAIRDLILRLCHRLIACSIAGRSQALEKVTVTDLFYLRGMDVDSVNGLTVIAPALSVIDMAELPDAAAGAHGVAQDSPVIDEGDQADPTPVHAPPPPPAAARSMPHRMARLEENMHKIRGTLAEQHEVIGAMARNFSKFYTWTTTSLARMMDKAGVIYTSYSQTLREYQRRKVRQRTGEANTSTAHQDQQQPDP
ncbi:hypothetical protein Tco_0765916 [Tanacetum coccineum]